MPAHNHEYESCTLTIEGQVATIAIVPPMMLVGKAADLHWDLGEIFSHLRGDTSVRVIVLTGSQGLFYAPPPVEFYDNAEARRYVSDPEKAWKTFTGVLRTHQGMAEIEKPILAKVNGNTLGFGTSLVFACDLIVADEQAMFCDIHLGMGEVAEGGPGFGIVPGDGGASVVPLHMPMAKAKEFLMLAKPYTGAEMAAAGYINYAVPAAELDALADDMVQRLLRRSAFALAWTKRSINRRVVDQLNSTLDASVGYEMVNFLQLDRSGGKDFFSLEG